MKDEPAVGIKEQEDSKDQGIEEAHGHIKEEEVENSEWFQMDSEPTLGREEQPEDEREDYDSENAADRNGESEPSDGDDWELTSDAANVGSKDGSDQLVSHAFFSFTFCGD